MLQINQGRKIFKCLLLVTVYAITYYHIIKNTKNEYSIVTKGSE